MIHAVYILPIPAEAFKGERPVVINCPVDYAENLRLTERLTTEPHAGDGEDPDLATPRHFPFPIPMR